MICSSLIDRADGVNPEGFYMQMFTAQLGAWLSWATWLVVKPTKRVWIQSKPMFSFWCLPRFFRCGLLVFALLKLCRYHQQENIRVRKLSPSSICDFVLR